MSVIKERLTDVIQNQPEDASYEEILKELAFDRMIVRGHEDAGEERTISNEEMKDKINAWRK